EETLFLLVELAKEVNLDEAIKSSLSRKKINETEPRAVLHTTLRAKETDQIFVDGENVVTNVFKVKNQIESFTNSIINGSRKGYTGKPFIDIVNIGIGGSDLGPVMVVSSVGFYKNHLNTQFISNINGDHI